MWGTYQQLHRTKLEKPVQCTTHKHCCKLGKALYSLQRIYWSWGNIPFLRWSVRKSCSLYSSKYNTYAWCYQCVQFKDTWTTESTPQKILHIPTWWILEALIFCFDLWHILGVDNSNGFWEVSEGGRISQVKLLRGIVCQHPGKHGVLRQVIVRPPC